MRLTLPSALPDVDLGTVDLADPMLYATGEPHVLWKALRERSPVHRQTLPGGRAFWSVTRYREVSEVLRDHALFTSERGTLLSILGQPDPAAGKMMVASDPPVHTALREPIARALSARALRPLEPRIRHVVRRMIVPLAEGRPWDVAAAGLAFPMAFTGTLMGVPEGDWERLARLTTMAVAPDDPGYRRRSAAQTLAAAHHELFEYFTDLVRGRAAGAGDLVGVLAGMAAGDRRLRLDEIVYNCFSLLLGANVTTPHTVAGTLLALIENPAEYRRLRADPALVPSAVEEGLRWSSPASHSMRHAVRDTGLGGRRIAAGDAVVAWLGSANRDPAAFPDPFRFDVARSPNRHAAFGLGPHYCVGSQLARIALRILFAELVRHVEEFQLAGPVEHLASNFVAGITRMEVTGELAGRPAQDMARAAADGPVPGARR